VSQPIKPSPGAGAPAVIGQGMIIKGSIYSKQDMFLDGEIEGGNLDVGNCRLTIGPHAKVVANARAREVEILGIITGNVESSENTSIRASGQMVGDIRTAGIVIESGALLKGRVEIVPRLKQNGEVGNGE
jgi:cytoskeletal protein CcmA (bactofilin family)